MVDFVLLVLCVLKTLARWGVKIASGLVHMNNSSLTLTGFFCVQVLLLDTVSVLKAANI